MRSRSMLMGLSVLALATASGCGKEDPLVLTGRSDASESTAPSKAENPREPAPAPGTAIWPHWRGPNRDAISRETLDPSVFLGMPPIVWRYNVGTGYSSVSVADGRLYTMGHREGNEEETVWCLDAVTGKLLWHLAYPCALLDHLHKGGPGATPTIDGDYVYVNSREGEVRKLEAETGKVVWVFDIRKELDLPLPEWGLTCSPIVRGNEIILEAGSLFAIDKETGQLKWRTTARMPGYGTPELFDYQGQPHAAALTNEGVTVVDLSKTSEVCFYPWESPYDTNSTTPMWKNGELFVSTGYNVGCGVLDFNGQELSVQWQNKAMRNHMNSCVEKDGWLYGFDGNSHNRRTVTLNCVNWDTGETAWSVRDLGCGALMATQEHLIILSDQGELLLAEMAPDEFRELGRLEVLDEQCWTMPVLCNGYVYCRGADGGLACVDLNRQD